MATCEPPAEETRRRRQRKKKKKNNSDDDEYKWRNSGRVSHGANYLIVFGARGKCKGTLNLFHKQVLVSGQYLRVFDGFVEQRQHLFPPVPEL